MLETVNLDNALAAQDAVNDAAYILAQTSSGDTVKISKADLATVVAELIPTVGANKRGLMPLGSYGFQNGGSVRLFTTKTTSPAFTTAVLLSLNASNGTDPSLLYVMLTKATNSNPIGRVKCIYGNYPMRILWKDNSDGSFSVYVERLQYTPGFGAILLSGGHFVAEGMLTPLSDNSEIDATCTEFTTVQ